MSSLWFNVPFLYCRFRMLVSHSVREKRDEGLVSTHDAQVVIAGAFRLQAGHGVQAPYFFNDAAVFRVQGRCVNESVQTGPVGRMEVKTTMVMSGVTTPNVVSLSIDPDFDHQGVFKTGADGRDPFVAMQVDTVRKIVGENLNHTEQEHSVDQLRIKFSLLQWKLPEKPGELRFDETSGANVDSIDGCRWDCERPKISGVLRLTPGIPAFRIVDDSVEQNPVPNCRIRVQGPDRREQEFETDAQGEVFIPRTGDEVYTLLGVVQDEAPLAGALLGEWTVESMPDLP
ncbi:hypothetical protein D7Y13_36875 [Corallococcus praedator]|uniref:Uncharacterized protein n=1 Tax=Corallococcus praedator TaxID=2316724 RepID=A0ABX9Q715_9BACT|nr:MULTISPECIES: hypothetical protein [Corallococcus]RKH27970.1 hypothetical protein D7X75_25620 [Corallococcus sp. CA031C]RKH92412.1 hypothetical protein D7Y13_36875 [Corallococcus praedator]